MKYLIIPMFVTATILMSGCDHYTTKMAKMEAQKGVQGSNFDQIAPAAGQPMTFRGYLANEYDSLALYEQNETRDYPAAKQYFMKADSLRDGQMVSLNNVGDYKINDSAVQSELMQARAEIDNALQQYRFSQNRWALAVAHSRFDCWVDEAEEQKKSSACKAQFKNAMNKLIVPEPVFDMTKEAESFVYDEASTLGF